MVMKNFSSRKFWMHDDMDVVTNILFSGAVMDRSMTSGYQAPNYKTVKLSTTGWPRGVDLLDFK